MFTGIVESTGTVTLANHTTATLRLGVKFLEETLSNLEIGASVSINGVCLTVTEIEQATVYFDIIVESLHRTTLQNISIGDSVNIERSLTVNSEIGGHPISGHIDGVAEVLVIDSSNENYVVRFRLEPHLRNYVFNKGFIAVHGISLTAGMVNQSIGEFTVWLIPETLRRTNLGLLKVGDYVNIELNRETQERVDSVSRTLQEWLELQPEKRMQIEELRRQLFIEEL